MLIPPQRGKDRIEGALLDHHATSCDRPIETLDRRIGLAARATLFSKHISLLKNAEPIPELEHCRSTGDSVCGRAAVRPLNMIHQQERANKGLLMNVLALRNTDDRCGSGS